MPLLLTAGEIRDRLAGLVRRMRAKPAKTPDEPPPAGVT
jgi:hypothetical protein